MKIKRAIAGGVLAETLLIVPVTLAALATGALGSDLRVNLPTSVAVTLLAGSFAMPLLLTQWVARGLTSKFVLHGTVVGFTAFAVYTIPMLLAGEPQPPMFWMAHALKVLGGATGGLVAARRAMGLRQSTAPV